MKRRHLITAFAGAAAGLAEDAGTAIQTLYIPDAHRVEDLKLLHDTMDDYSFAALVTTSARALSPGIPPGPVIPLRGRSIATHMPGAYEDFVRLVVPELQRRGLFQRDYAGATLRENLGLPRAR